MGRMRRKEWSEWCLLGGGDEMVDTDGQIDREGAREADRVE